MSEYVVFRADAPGIVFFILNACLYYGAAEDELMFFFILPNHVDFKVDLLCLQIQGYEGEVIVDSRASSAAQRCEHGCS